jgi:hypothetical protein
MVKHVRKVVCVSRGGSGWFAGSRPANVAGEGGGSPGRRRGSDVPMKPGNSGGGKDPCFWCVWEEEKTR